MSEEKSAGLEDGAGRFITVGTRILEIGQKLKAKRAERDSIGAEISKMEKEIGPLMVEHQQLMAALVGTPVPVAPTKRQAEPVDQQSGLEAPDSEVLNTPIGPVPHQVKVRVINAMRDADPDEGGVSASDIASQLNVPLDWVRAVMLGVKPKARGVA